jgi:copper transport protein
METTTTTVRRRVWRSPGSSPGSPGSVSAASPSPARAGADLRRPLLAGVVVALGALLAPAGTAFAHAELLEISPPDGAVIAEAPAEAVLRFNEPVSLTGGSAAVLDDTGSLVSAPAGVVDVNVVIPLDGGLGDGTYTITWSVISTDSHRISGASVFHVGAPSAAGPVDVGGASGAGWGVRALASVLTGIAYAGALVAVGGWWITMLLVKRAPGERWAMVIDRAAILAAAALVGALPVRIARLGGGVSALRDGDFLSESLRGPLGVSTAVTASGLLAMAAFASVAQRRWSLAWGAALAGAVALAGFAIEGHTRSQQPVAAMVALDIVHLAAGALWLGGIAALVTWFRAGVDPGELARLVVRFSTIAVVAVLNVVAAGVGMALIVVPSFDDLFTTGYGLALLTKVALVIPVIAMGAYNRRRLVPQMTVPQMSAGAAAAPASRLARIVLVELAILLVVVAVTAVLVARSPVTGSAAAGTVPAPTNAVEVPLSNDAGTASIVVAPARAGSNEIRLTLTDAAGQPLEPVETPTVELTEVEQGIGPLRPIVHPFGGGEYHVIADFPLAGTWEVEVDVRVSDFDAASASTTVEIAP